MSSTVASAGCSSMRYSPARVVFLGWQWTHSDLPRPAHMQARTSRKSGGSVIRDSADPTYKTQAKRGNGSRQIKGMGQKMEAKGRKASKTQMPLCQYDTACTRKGCTYRHTPKGSGTVAKGLTICMPFMADACSFGKNCRNRHPPGTSSAPSCSTAPGASSAPSCSTASAHVLPIVYHFFIC